MANSKIVAEIEKCYNECLKRAIKMKGVTTSLHDAFWHCIEVFAKEAQQGKH